MSIILPENIVIGNNTYFNSASTLVFSDNSNKFILLSERLKWPYYGAWGPPSGKSNFGETPKQTAMRELREETGLAVDNSRLLFLGIVPHVIKKNGIEVFMSWIFAINLMPNEIPQRVEANKMGEWGWFDIENLPLPLFPLIKPMLALSRSRPYMT